MIKLTATLLLLASMTTVGVALTGCAPANTEVSSVEVASDTMVIDVRTPAEFAAGHLEGAVNMDWQSADFTSRVEALDKNGAYVLYCKSGRRAGEAISMMQSLGFTNVSNLGGLDEAASVTGIAVVTN